MKKLFLLFLLLFSLSSYAVNPSPLKVSQGDNGLFNFAVTTDGTTPLDLTGATFETKLVDVKGGIITIANSDHAITNSSLGYYRLTLSTDNSAALHAGLLNMAVRITQSGLPQTVHANGIILIETYP